MENLKILIPTDFSVQAEFAYLMVKNLGSKLPVDIHFLHVLNVPDTVTMDGQGSIQTCGEIDVRYVEQQRDIALRKLANLKTLYGQDIETHLALGKTIDTVVGVAASHGFDMVVMGTKGASGIRDIVSGTDTQMIVRRSQVPVLSLMCDRSDLQIQNLLLVHDFSENGNQDMKLMHRILAAFGAKVHLMQVASSKDSEESIRRNMDLFAKTNGLDTYETHVLHDRDVESGVIHFNQMHNTDIVCIGTHGKGGWFHSSTTEKLVKHLFKPIISFHLKEK
jgi:nucleotide-binding universal stress UspA family protein